jgi:hypothetical protein
MIPISEPRGGRGLVDLPLSSSGEEPVDPLLGDGTAAEEDDRYARLAHL